MFKKRVTLGSHSPLSSKDKKTLQSTLQALFPTYDWSLFFAQQPQLHLAKLSGSKSKLYSLQEEGSEGLIPAFVDRTGKGEVFPTLFVLWKVPEAVRAVEVGSGVSPYLMNGADLMWPGVCSPLEIAMKYPLGTVLSIKIRGNPLPLAIGRVLDPGYFASEDQVNGKFIEVFHVYRDELWKLKPLMPNPGFDFDQVFPLPEEVVLPAPIAPDIAEPVQQTPTEGEKPEEGKIEEDVKAEPQPTDQTEPTAPPEEEKKEEGDTEATAVPVEVLDDNIKLCFLTTLLIGIMPEDLPLEPSRLQAVMLLCKPKSMQIDFKRSSHKKIGAYLKAMHKVGLIAYTKAKGYDHELITSVNKSHELLSNFEPIVREKAKERTTVGEERESAYPKVRFSYGLRPGKELRKFFAEIGVADLETVVLSKEDAQATLRNYITAHQLEENVSSKKVVRLDPLLAPLLSSPIDFEVQKSLLYTTFLSRFRDVYVKEDLLGVFPAEIKTGQIPKVTLTLSRKVKGKKTTLIEGVEQYNIDPTELMQNLQHLLATSGFLQQKPAEPGSNSRRTDVQIMGVKYKDTIIAQLTDFYKVPAGCIEVKDFIKPKVVAR